MANPLETTFKNLQCDERYKKLERSLKVALLKNAERKSTDNGNTGAWANVSSINGDHLDISLAAMSIQSSRIGSEVVSSSTNLRNILLHKQHFNGPRNTVATSSENQFPTNKDNDDSAMMPPPRTPGISSGRIKRTSGENQRLPLLNMPINSGRSNIGFSVSTPASSISSIPKCTESMSINSSTAFQENNNYHQRNVYGDTAIGSAPKQERNFSRWRVLLNDKGQLIIKGTLECGKVARSKPVIRRLTPTSVQSIFKHTYHLQGNLEDDRDELPDYVRGKFYNGFPDDWENVYQVWRNFVNDGNRLSFRWPTPVTDSDDDIKSGITEITYRPQRSKKTVSPRKRKRLTKTSKLDISAEDNENHLEPNSCSYSHNISSGAPLERSIGDEYPQPENSPQGHSKTNSLKSPCKSSEALGKSEKLFDCNVANWNVMDKSSTANSLAGYIPEDKLNIIVDNLTNKNCPMEYINKIVEMFECMKYVVSYQSSVENESVKDTSVTQEKKETQTTLKKDRSEKCNVGNKFSSKSSVNTAHSTIPKADQYDNQLPLGSTVSGTNEKSYIDHGCQTRLQFMENNYESSESDNDCYEDTRRALNERFSTSNEKLRKTPKYKNPLNSVAYKASREYAEPEKSPKQSRRQYAELNPRKQRHDSSISDEEFVVKKKREPKLGSNRTIVSPRKIGGVGKENRRETEFYDSSISITEDEERTTNKAKAKDIRTENYDSSVSITEDEYRDQNARNRTQHRKYYPETKANHLESKMRGNGNTCDDRKRLGDLHYCSESKSRSLEQIGTRTENNRGARKRLDSLDYCPESNSYEVDQSNSRSGDTRDTRKRLNSVDYCSDAQSHQIDQGTSRDGDVRDVRKKHNSVGYYSDAQSRPGEQNINRNGDTPGNMKRLDSLKNHAEMKSCSNEQDMSDDTPLRKSKIPQKVPTFTRPIAADDSDCETSNTLNPAPKVHGSTTRSNVNVTKEHEDDSAYSSRDNNGRIEQSPDKRLKKMNENREAAEVRSCKSGAENHPKKKEFQWSPESPEVAPPKGKTPQVRKKLAVTKIQAVDVHLKAHEWQKLSSEEETEQSAGNLPRSYVDGPKGNSSIVTRSNSVTLKSPMNTSEPTNTAEPTKAKTRSKEVNGALKVQDNKSSIRENKSANGESPKDSADNAPICVYGSKENPKLLTAWVPTVICDTDGDKTCHLVFEGKLLNEAGHVADRKFVTDSVRRRLSPKLIETFGHDVYKLVGDLNDTKHVVPKELIKVCHSGCPSKIAQFCEKWKSLAGETYSSPPEKRAYNTSVDCLSVPMSSRGRRILPPLNYWAGERVVIKDNKTLYSPGNSQESSIPSSLDNTTLEVRNKKSSPKSRTETKKANELRTAEKTKKDLEKVSPPSVNKSTTDNPSQQSRAPQKTWSGKRRHTRNVQLSSSESDDGADTKPTPRKRKTRASDNILNRDNAPTRKLRNSTKNSTSPQSLEEKSISPQKNVFKKPLDPQSKGKFRKPQKVDDNQGTLQQFVTRRPTDIKCTYYKNVPMHDGDLSEDQLSTI